MEKMKGHNVLLIAGGLGLAPLRAPSSMSRKTAPTSRRSTSSTAPRIASQLLFDYQYEQWRRIDGVNLAIIVEKPDRGWNGPVGLVTDLLENIDVAPDDTYAIVCGPPVMFKFVCTMLGDAGDAACDRMFVSLERRMHCGMGKCCRCNVGSTYTCMDGPVFDFWTVMNLKEAI